MYRLNIWYLHIFVKLILFEKKLEKKQAQCAYVVAIMGLYWVFEVLPLAITALIPMVAFPFFEIMKSDDVAQAYLPDTSFLFIGGLMVAVAVEKSELHTRIALFVLKTVGSQPRCMWISNTATAALMVPIVQSVIMELVANHSNPPINPYEN
uniref:CitMHS domain-containing protein n=1 Tax=Heterorhabditis bacteriophora TaxID=37862 RepID=A0A1I7WW19_HETBA